MPGFLSPGKGVPLLLIPDYSPEYSGKSIRATGFLTDPKQHTGSLLLNASSHIYTPKTFRETASSV